MYQLSELPNLITPLPIYGLILVAVIAWRTRRLVWWSILIWGYLMSIPVLASWAGGYLEDRYRPIDDLRPYQGYRVVLLSSGSTRLDAEKGWINQLANSGWERLLVATQTARAIDGELVIAGGSSAKGETEPISITMKRVIETMGIDLKKVTVETASRNTFENLSLLKDQLSSEPFILVTSATHLPRAMAVAEKLGLQAIPQPADYLSGKIVGPRSFLPSLSAILHWHTLLHELVGFFYYNLKGYR